jgi:hypothetical protein
MTFPGKVQIGLGECASIGLVGVAVTNPKIVLEDEIKRCPAGFRYMQTNEHLVSGAGILAKAVFGV